MATHSSILAWKFYGQSSLGDYNPWDCKESDTTEVTEHTHTRMPCDWSQCKTTAIQFRPGPFKNKVLGHTTVLPWWLSWVKNLPTVQETWVRSLGWVDTLEKERLPTPVFWPGEFHGLYSPWGGQESNTTEQRLFSCFFVFMGFPDSSVGKESAFNAGDCGSIPGLGRSPGERKGYPLQYSCLENSSTSYT